MSDQIITRFAPSPTGFLHIGGARTALFNWLYARAKGGQFLLRIEDTDRERCSDQAVNAILDGLKWLGLEWDDEPVHQFARKDRHQEVAQELLAKGLAYYCYCSPEQLDAMRERARKEGRPPRYDGSWRERDPAEAPPGVKPVIRFKVPQHAATIIQDQVQGDVTIQNDQLDDLIMLRCDGTPTYMLSVVVDDHDMQISHVIRGDDHLTNTARQILIFQALGWQPPVFAHIPLIHGSDGAKLSKRHGALGIAAYRDRGYLAAALRNYLCRLGWSHGDDEIFSTEQAIAWFGLAAIGKSPARFDFDKLENLNGHYIRAATERGLLAQIEALLPHIAGHKLPDPLTKADKEKLRVALPGLKQRAKTLIDLVAGAAYLYAKRPLNLDDKAQKLLTPEARALLAKLIPALETCDDWQPEALETAVRNFIDSEDVKLGKIAQPLRAALTGTTTSPGIYDLLFTLGRDEALARIKDQSL